MLVFRGRREGESDCVASRLSFGALASRNREDLFTTEFAEGAEVGIAADVELPCGAADCASSGLLKATKRVLPLAARKLFFRSGVPTVG